MATLQSIKDDEVAASGGNLDNSIINARAVLPIKSSLLSVADDISLEINFRVRVSARTTLRRRV